MAAGMASPARSSWGNVIGLLGREFPGLELFAALLNDMDPYLLTAICMEFAGP